MSTADHVLDNLNLGTPGDESDRRLGELILYIADRCADDPHYGATKLNKLLYYADFLAFASRMEPITGVQYMSLPQGPVPRRLVAVREKLQSNGDLAVRERTFHGFTQKQIVPLRDADLSGFDGWEIAFVDQVIDMFRGLSARDMSDLSHNRVWAIAGTDGAPIPYQAVFISSDKPDPYDAKRTRELWDQRNASAAA